MRTPDFPPRIPNLSANNTPIVGYRYAQITGAKNDAVDYRPSRHVFETEEQAERMAQLLGGWYGVYFDDSRTGPFIVDWKCADDNRKRLWVAHEPLWSNDYRTVIAGCFVDLIKLVGEIDSVGGDTRDSARTPGEIVCTFRSQPSWVVFAARIRNIYGFEIQVGLQ